MCVHVMCPAVPKDARRMRQSRALKMLEETLNDIASLGRISPCAEVRIGAFVVRSGLGPRSLVESAFSSANRAGFEKLRQIFKAYLDAEGICKK